MSAAARPRHRHTDRAVPSDPHQVRGVVAGFVLVVIGTVPFLGATAHTDLVLISVFLFVRGLGAVTVTLMALAFEGLARDEVPHASVISRIGQQLGGSFGTAVLAVTLQAAMTTASSPALGFRHAFRWALASPSSRCWCPSRSPGGAAGAGEARWGAWPDPRRRGPGGR